MWVIMVSAIAHWIQTDSHCELHLSPFGHMADGINTKLTSTLEQSGTARPGSVHRTAHVCNIVIFLRGGRRVIDRSRPVIRRIT